MNISNVEGLLMSSYRNPLPGVNSYYGRYGTGALGACGSLGSAYGMGTSFYSLLQNQLAKQQAIKHQLTGQPGQEGCCCASAVHSGISTDSTWLSYQKYLMQQAAIMPFSLQSSLLSSAWGSFY